MSPRKAEWRVATEPVECDPSDKAVILAPGWHLPRWAVTRFRDPSGRYPTVTARAELRGGKGKRRAIVTEVTIGDGKGDVKAADLRALAPLMYDLAAWVLVPWATPHPAVAHTPEGFIRAMNNALRTPGESMVQREDEALQRWETEYQPAGMSQREAAEAFGLTYSSFRSYLTHARARRGY